MLARSSRAVAFVALLPLTAAAQTGCLDQSYLPGYSNGLEVTSSQTVTQTFTVGISGPLVQVDLVGIGHHRGTPSFPLDIRIVACDPTGVPNGATLATVTLQPAQVPAARSRLAIDLTPFSLSFAAGTMLGIRASSGAQPSTQTYAWWGDAPGGGYARGQVWLNDRSSLSVWDLGFETFVGVAAASRSYGTGHPGTNGVPTLAASAPPVLGSNFALLLGNSSGQPTQAALLAGFVAVSLPTPFGGALLVQPVASFTVQLAAGGASFPVAIPSDPALCGGSVLFQALQFDAGASASIAFSAGLELVLGS
ncbi:MAG: hypothetical protein IPM29_21495 [Planctomycetes bacterium]|nr:hypothetical protein [Planctomycetota bacterium]